MGNSLSIVKVGGEVVESPEALQGLLDYFSALQGDKLLVVGGGRTATKIASGLGLEAVMVDGRRVTDAPMLDVVTMVYAGLINKKLVAALQSRGVNAIGLSGADMDAIRCHKRTGTVIDYGFVGDVDSVNGDAIEKLLCAGMVPVFCAITHDGNGQLLNTNADTVATSIACEMASRRDVYLYYRFGKKGVMLDPSDPGSVIEKIDSALYEKLRADGIVSAGMIPKLDNAFKAAAAGVRKVMVETTEVVL